MKMIYRAGGGTNPTGLICSLHLKNNNLSHKIKTTVIVYSSFKSCVSTA